MRTAATLLALLPLSLGGCVLAAAAVVAAAATYGVIRYTENEAYEDFSAELKPTFAATVDALRHLQYTVPAGLQPGATEGQIATTNDVKVRVERHPGGFTRVRVRVGTFETDDHKRRARLILEEVRRRLPVGT